jgi:hypothetical protein
MAMNFNVEVDIVPVTINGETFNFDATEENLIKFFDFEKDVRERGKKLKNEFKKVQDNEFNDSEYKKVFDLAIKDLAINYNFLFGEGSFDRLYKVVPSFSKLIDLLDPICEGIVSEINNIQKKRNKEMEKKEAKYLIDKKKSKK